MIGIEYQDSQLIMLNPYTWTGKADGIYLKTVHYSWSQSILNDPYKVLLSRTNGLIYIYNEYYQSKYQAIEPSLVGDVLILGLGFGILDNYLVTGTNWKWVDNNQYLITNINILNGTKHLGDAEDENFIATLGTFDTILIDFQMTNGKRVNWDQFLNVGGSIIEMTI